MNKLQFFTRLHGCLQLWLCTHLSLRLARSISWSCKILNNEVTRSNSILQQSQSLSCPVSSIGACPKVADVVHLSPINNVGIQFGRSILDVTLPFAPSTTIIIYTFSQLDSIKYRATELFFFPSVIVRFCIYPVLVVDFSHVKRRMISDDSFIAFLRLWKPDYI